jgi:glycosyltransferase involved in cell wall biosynthesis
MAVPGNPSLSVLLPCYNAAATLEEALESLAGQTLADYELVVVDDGSTDETGSILLSWAERDQRLRLINIPHGGIVKALNSGLAACRAPIVARMDSDDRCHPQRLEKQLAFLEAHPEISVVSCRVAGFPAGQVRPGFQVYLDWLNNLLTNEDIRREVFVESPLPHPSVTFRRDAVIAVGSYQDHGWPEDYDLWLRLYLAGACFTRLPETLLWWREQPGRLTRVDARYSLENFIRAKACYLAGGPLAHREAVFIWGAGMAGRRLARQLERLGAPLVAFIDINPQKIGDHLRGIAVISPQDLPGYWNGYLHPVLLAAVAGQKAHNLLRRQLAELDMIETQHWWFVA